jgi:hypothetical protein
VNFLVSNVGGKMKTTGTTYWSPPNTGATNESCFSALPAGFLYGQYQNSGICQALYLHEGAYFWIINENIPTSHRIAAGPYSTSGTDFHYMSDASPYYPWEIVGASVRCLKDQ